MGARAVASNLVDQGDMRTVRCLAQSDVIAADLPPGGFRQVIGAVSRAS
jgi:hypothetical protein